MNTKVITYLEKANTPKLLKEGIGLVSSSILVNKLMAKGRRKAIRTVENACMP